MVNGGEIMPTSSITKPIVIRDKETVKRFLDICNNAKPKDLSKAKTGQYEEGKKLSKRFLFR